MLTGHSTGHCSTRDPLEPTTFWVNPQGRSFARMRVSDLVRVDSTTGQVVEGDKPVDASATTIHSPVYVARGRGPEQVGGSEGGVEAIVHVHGPHSKGGSFSDSIGPSSGPAARCSRYETAQGCQSGRPNTERAEYSVPAGVLSGGLNGTTVVALMSCIYPRSDRRLPCDRGV